MLADVEPIDWDFPALAAWWNVYALPALLLVAGAVIAIRLSIRGSTRAGFRRTTVRTIALIHLGLAIRAVIGLAQELTTLQTQGIPQSFPVTGLVAPAVSVVMNLAVGHGLWHLRPWGRWTAIGWDALVAALTVLVVGWQWKYHAAVRLDQWPDYLASDGLPWFLLMVMLLPATRRVFAGSGVSSATSGRFSPLALITFLLLAVVISTILVDAAGWVASSLEEMGDRAAIADVQGP
jgi:hypothetical protein